MVHREDWLLVQQDVMATASDLAEEKELVEERYKNITIAIQFSLKRKKQTFEDL